MKRRQLTGTEIRSPLPVNRSEERIERISMAQRDDIGEKRIGAGWRKSVDDVRQRDGVPVEHFGIGVVCDILLVHIPDISALSMPMPRPVKRL